MTSGNLAKTFIFISKGDSGYPLEPWLLTPVANPTAGTGEDAYNRAHTGTRVVVEQCIGLLKMRFRCLQKYRTLHFNPERCTNIITACAILHNVCLAHDVPVDVGEPVADEAAEFDVIGHRGVVAVEGERLYILGNRQRDDLIRRIFLH